MQSDHQTEGPKKKIVKEEHLDKKFAKWICGTIFYGGITDCWYEPYKMGPFQNIIFSIWRVISNTYLIVGVVMEVASNLRPDLTMKERNDAIQFSFAHPLICLKLLVVRLQRERIKTFFKKLIEDTRIPLTKQTESEAVRKSKNYLVFVTATMILCLGLTTFDGIKYHFKEGVPARTLVTYWPMRYHTGTLVEIARVFVQLYWWFIVALMMASDSICIMALIFLGYKFRTLQIYFKGIREDLLERRKDMTQEELNDAFRKAFTAGVVLHSDTLWCAKNLQSALGNVYSCQIAQSVSMLSICLIKLVRLERSWSFLIANMAFIICMLALTGTYMMAAGQITVEASEVPTAMFQSGWDLTNFSKTKTLVVVAIQRSQVPVIMTAFGIFDLSYNNFISVCRLSYSFFAVMY